MSFYGWKPYVPVAQRKANAQKKLAAMQKKKKGMVVQPVEVVGKKIATSFWGKGWCDHMDSFSDYENRLPRGRTYVRNGSVVHLEIREGAIDAFVSGSELYKIHIDINPIKPAKWKTLRKRCAGHIGTMLELLQGRLSNEVMRVVCDPAEGLFPKQREIHFTCNCPDWASMCKHVAAVFYGVGNRLDTHPELLFLLRGVDPAELVSDDLTLTTAGAEVDVLDADQVGDIFGIDLDLGEDTPSARKTAKKQPAQKAKATVKSKAAKGPVKATPERNATARKPATKKTARKTPPTFKATGKTIAGLRRSLGLSAQEFADRLQVSAASVRRWESIKGAINIQERILTRIQGLYEDSQE